MRRPSPTGEIGQLYTKFEGQGKNVKEDSKVLDNQCFIKKQNLVNIYIKQLKSLLSLPKAHS